MKKEQTNKTVFFKSLQKVIEDFKCKGISEVKTIALIYQVAFKIIEATSKIEKPLVYKYQQLDIDKDVVNKHIKQVHDCAFLLLKTVEESEAFHDLMTDYIEEIAATNKNLAQYFTPSDVADALTSFIFINKNIDDFNNYNKYVTISDPTGCGAGSLMLAALRNIKNVVNGFEDKHYQSIEIYINDKDEYLAKIAFFQILINSLLHLKPIGVIHCEAKDIIIDYEKKNVNLNIFVCDINRKEAVDFYTCAEKFADTLDASEEYEALTA